MKWRTQSPLAPIAAPCYFTAKSTFSFLVFFHHMVSCSVLVDYDANRPPLTYEIEQRRRTIERINSVVEPSSSVEREERHSLRRRSSRVSTSIRTIHIRPCIHPITNWASCPFALSSLDWWWRVCVVFTVKQRPKNRRSLGFATSIVWDWLYAAHSI